MKTLKDIQYGNKDTRDGFEKIMYKNHKRYAHVDKLKQVAKEWIKELRSDFPKVPGDEGRDIKLTVSEKIALTYWIKHFFNLEG